MKKSIIGIFAILAALILIPQSIFPQSADTPVANEQMQEDMQASLLSINAGGALLPFILVLGTGGAGFVAYMHRQRKQQK